MRTRKDDELLEELGKLLQEQFNLRMQKGTGQLTRPNEQRRVRRDIARVKTILSQREKRGVEE